MRHMRRGPGKLIVGRYCHCERSEAISAVCTVGNYGIQCRHWDARSTVVSFDRTRGKGAWIE